MVDGLWGCIVILFCIETRYINIFVSAGLNIFMEANNYKVAFINLAIMFLGAYIEWKLIELAYMMGLAHGRESILLTYYSRIQNFRIILSS